MHINANVFCVRTAVQNERDKIIRRNPAAAAGAKAARSASTSSFGSPAEGKSLQAAGGGTPTWSQAGGSSPYPSPSHATPAAGVPLPIPAPTLAELLATLIASHEVRSRSPPFGCPLPATAGCYCRSLPQGQFEVTRRA